MRFMIRNTTHTNYLSWAEQVAVRGANFSGEKIPRSVMPRSVTPLSPIWMVYRVVQERYYVRKAFFQFY